MDFHNVEKQLGLERMGRVDHVHPNVIGCVFLAIMLPDVESVFEQFKAG